MSRLDELIKELCPDGIQYYKLKEVCDDIIVPMRDRPKIFDGAIPWCRIEDKEGQFFNDSLSGLRVSQTVIDEMKLKVFPTGTVICSCSASIGAYAINTQPLITNQTFIGLVCGKSLYNKYLLYYMETQTKVLMQMASTGTIPYISRKKFEELSIPVPPIEVQNKIVQILDVYSESVSSLQQELEKELTARKKQYEYYRSLLLDFGVHWGAKSECKLSTLKEIALRFCSGGTPLKGNHDYYDKGTIPWLRTQDVTFNEIQHVDSFITELAVKETSAKWIPENCVIVAISGASAGRCAINKIPLTTNQHCLNIQINPQVALYKYVFYCVTNQYEELLQRKEGARGDLNASRILSLKIPVPAIEEQERIVSILDHFDKLRNDISETLSKEIVARQKQYEYYRDKLLTFKMTKEA